MKTEKENKMNFLAGFIMGIFTTVTVLAIWGCFVLETDNGEEEHEWNL